mmetsp:Transcript_29558/g.80868  ORF Transcript_29558/g.80868 Transcript_29558/m.80868 type:complete len:268 (-) Transcript_29558:671-1474(-)
MRIKSAAGCRHAGQLRLSSLGRRWLQPEHKQRWPQGMKATTGGFSRQTTQQGRPTAPKGSPFSPATLLDWTPPALLLLRHNGPFHKTWPKPLSFRRRPKSRPTPGADCHACCWLSASCVAVFAKKTDPKRTGSLAFCRQRALEVQVRRPAMWADCSAALARRRRQSSAITRCRLRNAVGTTKWEWSTTRKMGASEAAMWRRKVTPNTTKSCNASSTIDAKRSSDELEQPGLSRIPTCQPLTPLPSRPHHVTSSISKSSTFSKDSGNE